MATYVTITLGEALRELKRVKAAHQRATERRVAAHQRATIQRDRLKADIEHMVSIGARHSSCKDCDRITTLFTTN